MAAAPAKPLNARQLRFVLAYVANGGNGTQAAIEVGYSQKPRSAQAISARLLSNVVIKAEIARRSQKVAERAVEKLAITKAWVLEGLCEVARKSLGREKTRTANGKAADRYNAAAANRALELIGKELGMFVDRSEAGKPGDFAAISDEELDRRVYDGLVRSGVPESIAQAFARTRAAD